MYRRILVPLDGSSAAEAALPHAGSLASRLHADLILLRACAPLPNVPRSRYPSEIESAAERYLRGVAEPIEGRSVRVRTVVAFGDPARVIADVAGRSAADLIVMGSRARWATRLFRGGVLPQVLDACRVPVLVVRANDRPGDGGRSPVGATVHPPETWP